SDRVRLAGDVGRLVASFARVPTSGLDSIAVDAEAFAKDRAPACIEFQRRCGVSNEVLADIASCLDAAAPLVPDARRPPAHATIPADQLLVERRLGRYHLSGLIDFGDAMVMHPLYEIVTPVFLVVGPDRPALEGFFEAAGERLDEAASRRLV